MLSKATRTLFNCAHKQIHAKNIRFATASSKLNNIDQYESKLVVDCNTIVGECAIWDFRRELLCWIDIEGAKFWTYNPINEESKCFELPERIGSFALCNSNKYDLDTYFCAFETGACFYNLSTSKMIGNKIFEFEPNKNSRTNDGRVDKQGRFVFGGMDDPMDALNPSKASGVYRINTDLTYEQLFDNIGCTNSICFSNDGKTMYFTDTFGGYDKQTIFKYNYYDENKIPDNVQIHGVYDKDKLGMPEDGLCFADGSIVDGEDGVWNSAPGTSRVCRFNKNGIIDKIVNVPEPWPSCATFGGKDLDTMYITTINLGKDNELMNGTEKGGLYAVKLPVKGCKEDVFMG